MPKLESNKSYIILYADDFDIDVWESYCVACGVDLNATEIKINFDYKDVVATLPNDED